MARANLDLTQATVAATLAQGDQRGPSMRAPRCCRARRRSRPARPSSCARARTWSRYAQLARDDYASKQRREQADAQSRSADAQLRAVRQAVKVTEAQLGEALGQLDAAQDRAATDRGPRGPGGAAPTRRVAAAQAALDQAELNLSYTRIYAPQTAS
ncbi:MAG: hypothetical protein WDO24_24355, partial [Pseudomonadota bacterium]